LTGPGELRDKNDKDNNNITKFTTRDKTLIYSTLALLALSATMLSSGPVSSYFMPAISTIQAAAQISSNSTNNTNAQSSNPTQISSSNPPPKLQLLGTNSFYDNNQVYPGLHIVGEVLNNGTQTATGVSVSATLYDASNRVVGVGSTSPTPSDIMPGKKVPFEIVVSRDNIQGGDFRNIHNVSLQVG
jgi:hypothetical protein